MIQEKRSFAELIKSIYLYLFTAIGLILIIVGIFQTSNYVINLIAFDNYQLGYEENRCDYVTQPIAVEAGKTPVQDPTLQKEQKDKCLKTLEEFRRYKKITDGARAITFLIVGGGVFAFHLTRTNILSKRDTF